MKNVLLLALLFSAINTRAQQESPFTFNYKVYEAVDKWVVFPKAKNDSTFVFGFVYLDEMAGFTFNYESRLRISHGKLVDTSGSKIRTNLMKVRLTPPTPKVHILSDAQIAELGLAKIPNWLAHYKTNQGGIAFQKRIASFYNGAGGSELALPLLLKAFEKDRNDKDVLFELSYAYNALNRPKDAIKILQHAISIHPKDELLYKELVYAYMNSNQLDSAEQAFHESKKNAATQQYKSEMAYNITYTYFTKKNRSKFDEWEKITSLNSESNSLFLKNIESMKANWNR